MGRNQLVNEVVTLEEAKHHLRVEINEDDAYIESLIQVASQQAESYTRRPFSYYGKNIPLPIKHAILLITGHLYENRESQEIPAQAEYLLQPYKLWNL
ncbi:head-tail connector protein [Thermoactinomyces sp. DSM 45892]|uniref:head-tail connector protein n=1 Tax=Thermoactinomyces sp. DSM 45892 TaxID=1882753 RepID=UPI000895E97B|nr:head-tail connector protein [Thermoactinomyces sp. DSM 45892]SDY23056.1 Phage gp6-like head-tail connector protein [Thermoactinomyces sp. DSM 45892]